MFGTLVHTDDDLATRVQPSNLLITPQNLGCQRDKLVVNGRRFPVARAMRLQTSGCQDACHRGEVNRRDHGLLDDNLLQAPTVPMRQVQSVSCRLSTRRPFDLDAFERGKKRAGVRYVPNPGWLRRHAARSVATAATELSGLIQSNARSREAFTSIKS